MPIILDEFGAHKIGGHFDGFRQLGRGHRNDHFRHQAFHAQPGMDVATEADRHVDFFHRKIHDAFGGQQVDFHVGIARIEISQARYQPARGKHRRRRYGQRPGDTARTHSQHRAFELVERVRNEIQRVGRRLVQDQSLATLEQGDAEMVLEQFDLLADRRRSDMQLLRCTDKRAAPRGNLEESQGIERRKMTCH